MPEFSHQEENERKQINQRELLYPRVEEKGNMVVIVRVFREPKEKRYQKAIQKEMVMSWRLCWIGSC